MFHISCFPRQNTEGRIDPWDVGGSLGSEGDVGGSIPAGSPLVGSIESEIWFLPVEG